MIIIIILSSWCMNVVNIHCSNTNRQTAFYRNELLRIIISCLCGLKRGKGLVFCSSVMWITDRFRKPWSSCPPEDRINTEHLWHPPKKDIASRFWWSSVICSPCACHRFPVTSPDIQYNQRPRLNWDPHGVNPLLTSKCCLIQLLRYLLLRCFML